MQAVAARRLCLLALAAMLTACACGQHPPASSTSSITGPGKVVPVTVATVGYDTDAQSHFVLLIDSKSRRELPIMIGDAEAQAILLALRGSRPPRPLSDDLLADVIQRTGNHVDRVEISGMRGDIYLAKIFMDHGKYAIDSRPSDAIALAAQMRAPIYVAEPLLVEAARSTPIPHSDVGPRIATAFGITVEDLTPALADAFKVRIGSGVVVADTNASAKRAGIERGDIVTRVDSRTIEHPADFDSGLGSAPSTGPVAITILRDGAARTVMLSR